MYCGRSSRLLRRLQLECLTDTAALTLCCIFPLSTSRHRIPNFSTSKWDLRISVVNTHKDMVLMAIFKVNTGPEPEQMEKESQGATI